jgi:hypothetical protein
MSVGSLGAALDSDVGPARQRNARRAHRPHLEHAAQRDHRRRGRLGRRAPHLDDARARWTAPASGTPDNYAVIVRRFVDVGGSIARPVVGVLFTEDTRITLPPGILEPGGRYVITIRVETHDAPDIVQRVFRGVSAIESIDAVTGLLTPPAP